MKTFFTFSVITCLFVTARALGTRKEGEHCTDITDCVEPLYCLDNQEFVGYCRRKSCGACRIGHFCGDDGFCTNTKCNVTSECAGRLICINSTKECSSLSQVGQSCENEKHCLYGTCENSVCTTTKEDEIDDLPATTMENSVIEKYNWVIIMLVSGIPTALLFCCLAMCVFLCHRNS